MITKTHFTRVTPARVMPASSTGAGSGDTFVAVAKSIEDGTCDSTTGTSSGVLALAVPRSIGIYFDATETVGESTFLTASNVGIASLWTFSPLSSVERITRPLLTSATAQLS